MSIIAADISYFQHRVDDSYKRRWLIFRCCDGSFLDPNATDNAFWAKAAVKDGRMDGWTTYVVYRPGQNADVVQRLDMLGVAGGHVMIDVESWGGQIQGDRSDEINALGRLIAARVGWGRVWIYGNRYDLGSIAPRRDARMKVVLASYGGTKPDFPNLAGWQYTDGTVTAYGGKGETLPVASLPFGACDHNEIFDTARVEPDSLTPTLLNPMEGDMYELIRDEQGGVYQVSALVFRHVPSVERWKIAESSKLCVGNRTRQVNNRERDCLRADVNTNLSQLKQAVA